MGQLKVDGVYPVYGSMTSGFMRITGKDGSGFFCDALPSSSDGEDKLEKKIEICLLFIMYMGSSGSCAKAGRSATDPDLITKICNG